MKRLIEKAIITGRSFQEALTSLRAQSLGKGLPSPAQIIHGRSFVTRKAMPIDMTVVNASFVDRHAKYTQQLDKTRQKRSHNTSFGMLMCAVANTK